MFLEEKSFVESVCIHCNRPANYDQSYQKSTWYQPARSRIATICGYRRKQI